MDSGSIMTRPLTVESLARAIYENDCRGAMPNVMRVVWDTEDEVRERYRSRAQAVKAHIAMAGWALVPEKPTDGMVWGIQYPSSQPPNQEGITYLTGESAIERYRAMLAARPKVE